MKELRERNEMRLQVIYVKDGLHKLHDGVVDVASAAEGKWGCGGGGEKIFRMMQCRHRDESRFATRAAGAP